MKRYGALKALIEASGTTASGTILEVLGVESQYDHLLKIENGKLVYKMNTTMTEKERKWLLNFGILVSKVDTQELICSQNPTIYYIADETNIDNYNSENIGTLMDFRTLVNGNNFNYEEARLIEDIYLNCDEENQWVPIGTSTYKFTKIFDGQMHTISGIYINDTTVDYVGLFGYVNGTIQNVGVKDGTIIGNNYVAGICAYNTGSGEIYRCFNELDITANSGRVAGICASINGGRLTISECYNEGTISVISTEAGETGGICGGGSWGDAIYNCYNKGEIAGRRHAGGIFGFNGVPEIYNCYNIGNVTSTYCGGSIHGMNYCTDLRNCFGLTGTFGSVSSYNNAGYGAVVTNCSMKSKEEMQSAEFVTILNTLTETVTDETTGEESIISTPQDVWVQDTTGINGGYPILKWQLEMINNDIS